MAGMADVAKVAGVKLEVVKSVVEAIAAIAATDKVILKGFGAFQTKIRAARQGRNPQTGETLTIAAKTVMAFKQSPK